MNAKTHKHTYLLSCIVFLFLIYCTRSSGQSYFNGVAGYFPWTGDARSMSLGHTGVGESHGLTSLWINPALLSERSSLSAEISFAARIEEEQRSFPVIDMFDDRVTENIYNLNNFWYQDAIVGLSGRVPLLPVTVAIGKAPYLDYRYNYEEEIRGSLSSSHYNRDPLVGYHRIVHKGKLNVISGGVGAQIGKKLFLGGGIHFLIDEDIKKQRSVIVLEEDDALAADTTKILTESQKLRELPRFYSVGLAFDFSPYLRLGVSYKSKVNLTYQSITNVPIIENRTLLPAYTWIDSSITLTQRLPGTITAGLQIRPPNSIPTKVFIEINYTDWSAFRISYSDSVNGDDALPINLKNVMKIGLGLEHLVLRKIPFRIGFLHARSPYGSEFDRNIFTIGTGFQIRESLSLDLAGEFSRVEYQYIDVFPAIGDTRDGLETVQELRGTFELSLKYVF